MSLRHLRLQQSDTHVEAGLALVRRELELPDEFPADVLAEAAQAATSPVLPADDLTEFEFWTIDPPGSCDLDQAMHLSRSGEGYCVRYAIADVAAFVRPGGAIDSEAHRRGQTLYGPDVRTPLHPPLLSEGAASLLAGETRPALVWSIELDSSGEGRAVDVRRALVRSRSRLDYAEVQRLLDAGRAEEPLELLREVGRLREERERDRGGMTLPIPEQEVVRADGHWDLDYRAPLPAEGWNSQISLLTGMAAAQLMLYGEVGVLRTLPAPDPRDVARLRRTALALRVPWPQDMPYGQLVRTLDPGVPQHAALLTESTVLLRGAGYSSFDGGVPEQVTHAALAAEYAHTTAPLRRLVDRYVGEVCLALCAGVEVPAWAREALPRLPAEMDESDRRAGTYERLCVNLVEAVLMSGREGEQFSGVIIDVADDRTSGTVQLAAPAVRGRVEGSDLSLGAEVGVRLLEAEVERRTVRFGIISG